MVSKPSTKVSSLFFACFEEKCLTLRHLHAKDVFLCRRPQPLSPKNCRGRQLQCDEVCAVGRPYMEKAFIRALFLTFRKPRKLSDYCRRTQQQQMLMGMIYNHLYYVQLPVKGTLYIRYSYIHIGVGSKVARTDINGQFLGPLKVGRAKIQVLRFFCILA